MYLKHFIHSSTGSISVEFAFIAPVLLLIYLGAADVTRAIVFHQRLQQATTIINDLVAQSTKVSKFDLSQRVISANAVFAGADMKNFGIQIDAITIDATGKRSIAWTYTKGTTSSLKPADTVLPHDFNKLHDATLIVTQSYHVFPVLSTYVLNARYPMNAITFGRSRGRNGVVCTDCG